MGKKERMPKEAQTRNQDSKKEKYLGEMHNGGREENDFWSNRFRKPI